MLNNFLKYDTAKKTLVNLGATKLADIILFAFLLIISAPHIRNYITAETNDSLLEVKKNQAVMSKNQAILLQTVERHGRKIDSTNRELAETNRKQDVIIQAIVESKSKIELLKELYKSGVPGWTFYPVKKKHTIPRHL